MYIFVYIHKCIHILSFKQIAVDGSFEVLVDILDPSVIAKPGKGILQVKMGFLGMGSSQRSTFESSNGAAIKTLMTFL